MAWQSKAQTLSSKEAKLVRSAGTQRGRNGKWGSLRQSGKVCASACPSVGMHFYYACVRARRKKRKKTGSKEQSEIWKKQNKKGQTRLQVDQQGNRAGWRKVSIQWRGSPAHEKQQNESMDADKWKRQINEKFQTSSRTDMLLEPVEIIVIIAE